MTPRPLTPRSEPAGQRQNQRQTPGTTHSSATRSIELTGGESVYCINQAQLEGALRLAEQDGESGRRIQHALAEIERDLNRNERAALSFLLIERLRSADA